MKNYIMQELGKNSTILKERVINAENLSDAKWYADLFPTLGEVVLLVNSKLMATRINFEWDK